jgi:hypothetical protein
MAEKTILEAWLHKAARALEILRGELPECCRCHVGQLEGL